MDHTDIDYASLEKGLVERLVEILEYHASDEAESALAEIQPPSTVIQLAAKAAAAVFIAFERGYQMDDQS
jgi:hypothetical protein